MYRTVGSIRCTLEMKTILYVNLKSKKVLQWARTYTFLCYIFFCIFLCNSFSLLCLTHLIKHQHGTSEQGLGLCRDSSHLTSEQVKEPVIRVESKVTSLQRKTSISSANELGELWTNVFWPQAVVDLKWNEPPYHWAFMILANWLNSLSVKALQDAKWRSEVVFCFVMLWKNKAPSSYLELLPAIPNHAMGS